MTSKFCTCQSPSRRRKVDDALSSERDKVTEELVPLPNGFTHQHDNGDAEHENTPCLAGDDSVRALKKERKRRIYRVWDLF